MSFPPIERLARVQHAPELVERMTALVRDGLPFEDRLRMNPRIAIGRNVRFAPVREAPDYRVEAIVRDIDHRPNCALLLVTEDADGMVRRVPATRAKFLD